MTVYKNRVQTTNTHADTVRT